MDSNHQCRIWVVPATSRFANVTIICHYSTSPQSVNSGNAMWWCIPQFILGASSSDSWSFEPPDQSWLALNGFSNHWSLGETHIPPFLAKSQPIEHTIGLQYPQCGEINWSSEFCFTQSDGGRVKWLEPSQMDPWMHSSHRPFHRYVPGWCGEVHEIGQRRCRGGTHFRSVA